MKVFLLACSLLVSNWIFSQSVIAKFKYEEAEEAFNKNDFVTTLQKLDETEKLLGVTNPKILYLRIMTEKAILEKGNYEYALLDSTRQHTAFYLSHYEKNEGIEDKLKEVYLFAETLQKFPKSAAELTNLREAPAKAKAAKEAAATAFADSLANAYQFKKGLTEEAFRKYNSFSAELVKKKKLMKESFSYRRKEKLTDTYDYYLYDEGPTDMDVEKGIVTSFTYVLKRTSADKSNFYDALVLFETLKARIKALFPPEAILESKSDSREYDSISVSIKNSSLINSISLTYDDPGTKKYKYRDNVVEIQFN